MAIYLFYVCRNGRPETFEAYEVEDDAEALAFAPQLLATHGSSDCIEVCQGERLVGALSRGPHNATYAPSSGVAVPHAA